MQYGRFVLHVFSWPGCVLRRVVIFVTGVCFYLIFVWSVRSCGRGRKWKEALQVLEELRSEGVPPNSFVYCSAIDACSKVRRRVGDRSIMFRLYVRFCSPVLRASNSNSTSTTRYQYLLLLYRDHYKIIIKSL